MRRRILLFAPLLVSAAVARQAQGARPRLAILSPTSKSGGHAGLVYEPFITALSSLGWEAGQNIDIIERFADDDFKRLPVLAAELAALRPDVIFTNTVNGARAAAQATSTIPVVVAPAGENVFTELAVNFARPAANVTGVTLYSHDQDQKCLELLKEAAPSARRVGVLINPLNPNLSDYPASMQGVAASLGLSLVRMEARDADDVEQSIATAFGAGIQAVHVPDYANIAGRERSRRKIIQMTTERRIPVVSTHLGFARDGALLALGTDIPALARRGASYVDRILKGAKPADLPVERPTIVQLAVNLRAGRDLGLMLAPSLLLRADEVIE
jgi:putative tryptophan/tyrosine transport system substrate-binding protein